MTDIVDIVNRALQVMGTRTNIIAVELATNGSNEAIQANLIMHKVRQDLLRMAPWDCGLNYNNLTVITAAPGTPENPTNGPSLWTKGLPPPPWAYEYQYPVDCLKACWIVPQFQTGFASGVPITTAVTGGAPAYWGGPPIKFKVGIDQFYPVTAAAIASAGADYVAGEVITLEGTPSGDQPIGAPVQIRVLTVNGGGAILTSEVVNQVEGSSTNHGGSYFAPQANPVAQGLTTGDGSGATFNLTFATSPESQRVIWTNQEFATLAYVKDITDINVMDPLFQDAWVNILGARLCLALTGDKTLANMCINEANKMILEARKADGNEGLTVNDITPDFIRARGINWTDGYAGPYSAYDWGGLWPGIV